MTTIITAVNAGLIEVFMFVLFVCVALCFAAEPRALQCDEEIGDSTLGESFYHQGSEQVRHCVAHVSSYMVSVFQQEMP